MKERDFEDEIVHALQAGGWELGTKDTFRPDAGFDLSEVMAFLRATQKDKWDQVVARYGGDPALAEKGLANRLASELSRKGVLDLLRNGVKEQNVALDLAAFRPATSMNSTHAAKYAANRLTVVRQLRYSSRHTNTLDLGLLVNGLLVATAELKNPLTGQTVDHAMRQYREQRDPVDSTLNIPVVHFAVDPYLVYMTTRLAKKETAFLPFNRGRDGGRGNPDNPGGYDTAYLWEAVWRRDAWLDILQRFVQVKGTSKDRTTVFPRFHQWDAVRRLEQHAKANGPGHRYLVQHSAGSGKSNTISWLAHRLSNLHADGDAKVFDKVVVITDRRNLDTQLRANVKAFERVSGTVATVLGERAKSQELAEALASPAVKIIVTTVQVFPFLIAREDRTVAAGRPYAVIIDEAHSSQAGDAAVALRQALGKVASDAEDQEDAINALLMARGHQPNLSFFAFTATPKEKTNVLFGTEQPDGTDGPFHLYSMRQAEEEGFIVNVLEHYSAYKTYFKLAVTDAAKDREVDTSKAGAALRRMVVSDPQVIAQKAAIIVEHFRTHTAKKIGGLAKAMVVTDSRPAAVKYKRAIDAYIAESHYTDLRTLVAFSGTVEDTVLGPVTEPGLNGFPESQTGDRFTGTPPYQPGDYQVMIVAEKYQTGFDLPVLHTMFVDKTLSGLATVQTLSRLNRIHPDKIDTFVLDFRNDEDAIRKDFQRYYERTTTNPTSVNALTDAYDRLFETEILDQEEIRAVVEEHFRMGNTNLGAVYSAFAPALERFAAHDEDDQQSFRSALSTFLGIYSFLSQVVPWVDADQERTRLYGAAIQKLLPSQAEGRLDLGDDVVLTHLRIVAKSERLIELEPGAAEPGNAFPGQGQGPQHDPRFDTLADITSELNKQFGLTLSERDRLMFQQFEVEWLNDDDLREVAESNDMRGFRLEFERAFKRTVLDNEAANQELYERIYNDSDFSSAILNFYVSRMHKLLNTVDNTVDKPGDNTGDAGVGPATSSQTAASDTSADESKA